MKKQIILSALAISFLALQAGAQKAETMENAQGNSQTSGRNTVLFKPLNPEEDKTETVDISGVGAATFISSNFADGTPASYRHTQMVTLKLQAAGNKPGSYQLVFYPEKAEIKEAAASRDGVLSIYYPLSMFTTIKTTLEQNLAARKKVSVKVVMQKDGYREGSLVF
ncbi:MAG: hypothetical protein IPP93_03835 [Chitinophagaceae bacterium]|nr:hypothetical protein [Chitinophagaceae bacterium]